MFLLIIAIVVGLGALGCLIAGIAMNHDRTGWIAGGIVGLVLALGIGIFSASYTQDVGEAKVLRSFTGEVVGVDLDEGMAMKAPWVEAITFDIRNQQAIYKGNGEATSEAEEVNGPEIAFQDKDKVSGNADIAIRYSIDPNKVGDIFNEYPSQEALTARLIDQDMRAVVRNAFSSYTTAGVLESRVDLEKDIAAGLAERWEGTGVIVETAALQGIRYPEATQTGFESAQQSATRLKEAQAELKVREAEAEKTIVDAKAEAESNRLVSESLTPEVNQKNYIEALRHIGEKGNLVVVPEGSQPVVQTTK